MWKKFRADREIGIYGRQRLRMYRGNALLIAFSTDPQIGTPLSLHRRPSERSCLEACQFRHAQAGGIEYGYERPEPEPRGGNILMRRRKQGFNLRCSQAGGQGPRTSRGVKAQRRVILSFAFVMEKAGELTEGREPPRHGCRACAGFRELGEVRLQRFGIRPDKRTPARFPEKRAAIKKVRFVSVPCLLRQAALRRHHLKKCFDVAIVSHFISGRRRGE